MARSSAQARTWPDYSYESLKPGYRKDALRRLYQRLDAVDRLIASLEDYEAGELRPRAVVIPINVNQTSS